MIALALSEAEEISAEHVVEDGSAAAGHTIKELQIETETGMFVLAVQRGRRWIYRPRAGMMLLSGDRVISVGPEEGAEEMDHLCRASTLPSGP